MHGKVTPNVSSVIANDEIPDVASKSYVNVVSTSKPNPKLIFRMLFNEDKVENSDFVLPVENVVAAQNKFANSLVGFFFSSTTGLEHVLEQGPSLIRNQPLILTKWAPNLDLAKDVVTKLPIWVKIHKVPVVAYSDDGIASQIGKPVMMDAFTSSMCSEPWGRMGYARALIKVSARKDLKNEVKMDVPKLEEEWHTIENMKIEYEWKPPWCKECLVFGHNDETCPKKVTVKLTSPVVVSEDGFTTVVNRKSKGKGPAMNAKNHTGGFKDKKTNEKEKLQEGDNNGVKLKNLFEKLNDITSIVDPNNSEVEELIMEENPEILKPQGASTPFAEIPHSFGIGSGLLMQVCVLKVAVSSLVGIKTWEPVQGKETFMRGVEISQIGGRNGILKKLDRIMGNIDFVEGFPGSYTIFQPYRISDHSPAVLKMPSCSATKPKPFKFYNFLSHKSTFLEVVTENWNFHIEGHSMFRLVQKMKSLKKPLRKLLHDQGNLHDRVNKLRIELDEVQKAIDSDPLNYSLRDEEAVYLQAFNEAMIDEERFLKQKAKIEWLDVGDSNSAFFHKSIKSRNQRSRIEMIRTTDNVEVNGSSVPGVFVAHYKMFLGTCTDCEDLDTNGLFVKKVSDSENASMIELVTTDEIKRAMFGIGDDKASGPDGFTSAFFKKGWDVVGQDVCRAVQDFFVNGQLLKEVNHTFLALIPKVTTPLNVGDYRPISCCNVIYKYISKILTNRIIAGIKEVVSENQSAFVPGRRISDNILITQKLMHNYHLDRGTPRCAFKVDIQKAYDTVNWRFLGFVLKCFGFHHTMVNWVMACMKSPSKVRLSDSFRFHKHYEDLGIINVCFADDLFLFARGDVESVKVIMESLNEFKMVSGLVPNILKSTIYFCNVLNHVKSAILNIMPFLEGTLLVKYLGVPLISSRLLNRDCKILVEKARNRIRDWKNKSLSFAGRLQLCNSVISSMQVEYKRGKSKVPWDDICLPKSEGGLGIRCLKVFNCALMTTHIWNIVINKESLWVRWIHMYKLKGRTLWDICPKASMSWGWRKLLQLKEIVKPFLWKQVGNGLQTSLWDDGMRWRDGSGNMHMFSVKHEWEALRSREMEVPCFSSKVWLLIRNLAGMDNVQPILDDITSWFIPIAAKRTFDSIVGKLLFAAAAYHIWIERNNRLFKNARRSPEEIRDVIVVMQRVEVKDGIKLYWASLGFDFAFASHPTLRVQAYYEHPTRDLSRPLPATPLTTLPPSVPQEAPPQLAPLLDLLILSSS
ncbi:protein LAZ1 [Tanacetum coccineum]